MFTANRSVIEDIRIIISEISGKEIDFDRAQRLYNWGCFAGVPATRLADLGFWLNFYCIYPRLLGEFLQEESYG